MCIDFSIQGRIKKKTAWKIQTSAGNKQGMRRDDCYIFHRTQAAALAFGGSRDEGVSGCAETRAITARCDMQVHLMKKKGRQKESPSTVCSAWHDRNR